MKMLNVKYLCPLFLLFLVFCGTLQAQSEETPYLADCSEEVDGESRTDCTNVIMRAYFEEQMVYPDAAKENGIEGFVACEVHIDSTGTLRKLRVRKGPGYGCNEEAERLVRHFDQWVPAKRGGQGHPI